METITNINAVRTCTLWNGGVANIFVSIGGIKSSGLPNLLTVAPLFALAT
jgi:hypothetical protein